MERESSGAASPVEPCPDEQVILDLALGVLAPERRRPAWAHIDRCQDCARLIGAAMPFLGPPNANAPATRTTEEAAPGQRHRLVTPERSLTPGQILRNRYRIVRSIGRGAMGEVYEASHERLVGHYALKILNLDLSGNQAALKRFQREAGIASELRHPNIVQVVDFDETEDHRPYLVMELLDGSDLGAVLGGGRLPFGRVRTLTRQIAAGLSAMHEKGIIHRDLKPANVFVLPPVSGESERVKLVDFGLSKRGTPSFAVTHDRMLLGTPQYMAPEQARGDTENVGPASDQFALGAIVYEMLAGRPAFTADFLSAVLYRIVHEPPMPLADLAPELAPSIVAAIMRALAKDPADRFGSVREFLEAFEAAALGSPSSEASAVGAWTGRRRLRWVVLSACALGTGLAVKVAFKTHGGRDRTVAASPTVLPSAPTPKPTPATGAGAESAQREPAAAPPPTIAVHQAPPPVATAAGSRAKSRSRRHDAPVLTDSETTPAVASAAKTEAPGVEEWSSDRAHDSARATIQPVPQRDAQLLSNSPDAGPERRRGLVPHL